MSQKAKPFYLNAKQSAFLFSPRKYKTFLGGRGTGKSTVLGFHKAAKFKAMPRAKDIQLGLTYLSLANKTLPAMEAAWNMLGFREYDKATGLGHYVVGQKPPAGWARPWQPPRKYEHCISWINGYTIEMVSQERMDLNRGGNYDCGDSDETAFLKEEFLNRIGLVSIRGNTFRFGNCHLHHSFCHFTSAPYLLSGQFVFKPEEKAREEADKIKAGAMTPGQARYQFIEASTAENLLVLGDDYLQVQREILTDLEYAIEIENKRIRKMADGFYPSLSEDHLVIDVYDYDYTDSGRLLVKQDTFTRKDVGLDISFDFNAGFTSMVIAQEVECGDHRQLRIIDNLWVKPGQVQGNMIDGLVDKFIAAYKSHPLKIANVYGDRNGNNRNPQSEKTFYDSIIDRLLAAGWVVNKYVSGLDTEHDIRHRFIDSLLQEHVLNWPRIRFHHQRALATFTAMQNTKMLPDWKKDKSPERHNIPQEQATHLTDCVDNMLTRKYAHLMNRTSSGADFMFF